MTSEAQIWGWWNDRSAQDTAYRLLETMGRDAATEAAVVVGQNFAIAVHGGSETYGAWEDEHVAAVCYGCFRWDDSDLASCAKDNPAYAVALAYNRYGPDFVDRMKGTWSCAVVDRRGRGRVVLLNDRIGAEPLCYGTLPNGGIVFATRAESVADHPAISPDLDYQALHNYLYFTRVPAPRTIFQQIRKFSTATRLVANPGEVHVDTYWRITYRDSTSPARSLHRELQVRLQNSVRDLAACADRSTIGAFLSGGLDSSTISGLLIRGGYVPDLLNVGFDLEAYNESHFARQAAEHFGHPLTQLRLGASEVPRLAERIANIYDEPFANSSAVASLYAAEAASDRGVRTLFAGDGGDELFAGNDRYVKQLLFEQYFRVPVPIRRLLESQTLQADAVKRIPILGKAPKFAKRANIRLPDRLESYNFFNEVGLERVYAPDLADTIDPHEPSAVLHQHFFDVSEPASTLNRMMHLDLRTVLADDDLRKVTKTCRACGLAVRYPMLTDEVVEFAAQLPTHEQIKRFQLRHFYKRAMKGFLPPETLAKRKQGFGLPFAVWVLQDGEVQTFVSDHLSDLDARQLFDSDFLGQLREHPSDATIHAHGELVWVLLMLELWFKKTDANVAF